MDFFFLNGHAVGVALKGQITFPQSSNSEVTQGTVIDSFLSLLHLKDHSDKNQSTIILLAVTVFYIGRSFPLLILVTS